MNGRLGGVVQLGIGALLGAGAWAWWTHITAYNRWVSDAVPWRRSRPAKIHPLAEGFTRIWGTMLAAMAALVVTASGVYLLITGGNSS